MQHWTNPTTLKLNYLLRVPSPKSANAWNFSDGGVVLLRNYNILINYNAFEYSQIQLLQKNSLSWHIDLFPAEAKNQ